MSPANAALRVSKKLAILVLIGMFVQLGVVSFVYVDSHRSKTTLRRSEQKARVALAKAQRRACARGKKDRRDNAEFQKAQTKYISKVVLAQSVKEDVKDAARQAIRTFDKTSASLTERAKIDCVLAVPIPRTAP